MSARAWHEKAVPVEFADSTETAQAADRGRGRALLEHIGAAALAVAIVVAPFVTDFAATALIGPELIS